MDTLGGDVLGMIAESTGAPWIARQACRPMRAAVRVRAWPLASAVESPEFGVGLTYAVFVFHILAADEILEI